MSNGRVVHWRKEPYDVYIGRPSKWGNPFPLASENDRARVIEAYDEWVREQPELVSALHELRGKTLGCWCAPKPCHGDVLLKLAQEFGGQE